MTSIQECFEDPSLPGCNSCRQNSTFPGCNDPFCETRICENFEQSECCEEAWTTNCTLLAEAACIPEVIPVPPGADCPLGFICNDDLTQMANCSQIRSLPVTLKLGDVYAGIYCPEDRSKMQNCPIGDYCPTPFERYPCPEGMFCPHKSAKPWIECSGCEEESGDLVRDAFGYIVLIIGLAVLVVTIGISCFRKHQKDLWDRQAALLSRQVDSLRIAKRHNERQAQLDRLKPKLDIIAKRLYKIEQGMDGENEGSEHSESGGRLSSSLRGSTQLIRLDGDKKVMSFDSKRIYDVLDTNNDGRLSFDELNAVLGLDNLELKSFVSRMQELGGLPDTTKTVSRQVFVKYFLQVLEENSHLHVTDEEAEATYEEILMENGNARKLRERMLYNSHISKILSDPQIYMLIKKFRVAVVNGEAGGEGALSRKSTGLFSQSTRGVDAEYQGGKTISKAVFVDNYPMFLLQVLTADDEALAALSTRGILDTAGVDICFKNLSLSVKGLDRKINVVDDVTGRVQARTMTALMGGSGAGKTSLLNALCGRAYYGEVSGDIHINGQQKSIEEIKDNVGFVPQDDIVYAELTVRENFVYAGKFRLPKGTSAADIEELADETLASLGLSRVANSMVGDVKRRGVSGGEKKRVNIGLELMAKPSCLFLDEPTSGLDASSALLVMSSLKHLVRVQGVTVVSVIHQPRKFIFDLFDSLILLGVGGRMVYHGPTSRAQEYFDRLGYVLPQGESVADWLIDISSGRLEPENAEDLDASSTEGVEVVFREEEEEEEEEQPKKSKKKKKKKNKEKHPEHDPPGKRVSAGLNTLKSVKNLIHAKDDDVVGRNGVSTGKEKDAFEEAKTRRAWLYEAWNSHFESLSVDDKEIYEVPPETKLPETPVKQKFLSQLYAQTTRELLVSWRNSTSKLIDTLILVGATIVITVTDGLPTMTRARNPDLAFETIVSPNQDNIETIFQQLFLYAAVPQWQFPLKIGIIVAVLIGLQATRIVTNKRLEFFREASSGYNINAYFVAVHFVSTIEHSTQIVILSFFAAWLRDPVASWWSFFAHFLAMVWICVSWALFFPMVVPPDNVTVTVGFFMAFCGLMISGAFPPTTWKAIYNEGGFKEHIAGWFSPTRYFFEGLTVGEYRCLPPQSGWTVADESVNFDRDSGVMAQFGLAGHDPNATQQSCDGWYWGILPSIFVGLTVRYAGWLAMHTFNRAKQTKKSLIFEMKRDKKLICVVVLLVAVLFGLGVLTTWLYTRDLEPNFETIDIEELLAGEDPEELVTELLVSSNVNDVASLLSAASIGA